MIIITQSGQHVDMDSMTRFSTTASPMTYRIRQSLQDEKIWESAIMCWVGPDLVFIANYEGTSHEYVKSQVVLELKRIGNAQKAGMKEYRVK